MVTLTFITIFGLFVGSFLNVVIYRLPRECLSVVKDTRSRCPRCGLQLTWYDNIPVFSYVILLRGKCRGCRVPISFRYPFVELLTGAAFASLAWIDLGASGLDYPTEAGRAWLLLGVHALVLASLIALSAIDIDFRILPDAITLSGIVAAPVIVFLVPEAMPAPLWMPFADAPGTWGMNLNALANGLAGAAFAAGVLYGIGWLGSKAFRKPAMGLGDVKLFAAMGRIPGDLVPLLLDGRVSGWKCDRDHDPDDPSRSLRAFRALSGLWHGALDALGPDALGSDPAPNGNLLGGRLTIGRLELRHGLGEGPITSLIRRRTMKSSSCVSIFVLLVALVIAPGCASTGADEEVLDRRAVSLEEDNEALRKQLTDLGAVENALNREIASKKRELVEAKGSAGSLRTRNAELDASNRELRNQLDESGKLATRSVASNVDASGLNRRGVEVINSGDGSVRLRMSGGIMFLPGRNQLTKDGKRILDGLSAELERRPELFISVEGHTDATPLGKTKKLWGTNLALSLARAMSVHDYLKAKRGIGEARMRVVGWGEHNPVQTGVSASANAKNRRVELVLSRAGG